MKTNWFGLFVSALMLALIAPAWTVSQQPMAPADLNAMTAPTATANETMLMTSIKSGGETQVVLVDTQRKWMVVYEIANGSGAIQLKSVRNLVADFQLDEFNGSDPSPEKVRGILGTSR